MKEINKLINSFHFTFRHLIHNVLLAINMGRGENKMTQKKLHPSVLQFKEFVKNNPKIIKEVRSGKATWQELYEDWYLLGEEDKRWESVGAEKESESKTEHESKSDWVSSFMGMVKKMDPNQMQSHINNLSQALGAIQGVISQFQGGNVNSVSGPVKTQEGPKHPFVFRKD